MTEQEVLGQAIIDARKEHPDWTASQVHDRLMLVDALSEISEATNGDSCVNLTEPNPSWSNGNGASH